MELKEAFQQVFKGAEIEDIVYCPYRVCPIGAHVDHQNGMVTGFALDRGVSLAYVSSKEPILEIYSLNFEGRVRFTIKREPHRHHDWGDYARAAMRSLFEHGYELRVGFSGIIEGTLPIGGLSSSAAVILTYLVTLCRVNRITVSQDELIALALWAEREFIGLNVGTLDQSCEVYCRKDHLLYLDTLNGSYMNIAENVKMAPFKIGIFFSGVSRALVNSAYNARVDECKAAAYSLKAYAQLPYGKFAESTLRDVPKAVYEMYKERLPENFKRRAEHYYSENDRVQAGVEAWKNGDIHAFGKAIFESGKSSIYSYESGSPELKALYEIMLETKGIYGGRFSGAGFKGCCMAVVDPDCTEQIEKTITEKYLRIFPDLEGKFSVHFCETSDGIRL